MRIGCPSLLSHSNNVVTPRYLGRTRLPSSFMASLASSLKNQISLSVLIFNIPK